MAIETLNIDGVETKVADLPVEVRQLIEVYEHTHAKRNNIEIERLSILAALKQLSDDITNSVKRHQDTLHQEALAAETPEDTE